MRHSSKIKNRRKRTFLLILSLVVLFAVGACADDSNNDDNRNGNPPGGGNGNGDPMDPPPSGDGDPPGDGSGDTVIYSTTITTELIDIDDGLYGYLRSSSKGAANPDEFTHDGTTYTLIEFSKLESNNNKLFIKIMENQEGGTLQAVDTFAILENIYLRFARGDARQCAQINSDTFERPTFDTNGIGSNDHHSSSCPTCLFGTDSGTDNDNDFIVGTTGDFTVQLSTTPCE